jgi:hypothetical protein
MRRAFLATLFLSFCFSVPASTNDLSVSVAPNPWIDVAFVSKVKSKRDGWIVSVRITNKLNKPISSLSTSYELKEGDWKVGLSNVSMSQTPELIKPKASRVLNWFSNVPSSVDRIHILEVEPKFLKPASTQGR